MRPRRRSPLVIGDVLLFEHSHSKKKELGCFLTGSGDTSVSRWSSTFSCATRTTGMAMGLGGPSFLRDGRGHLEKTFFFIRSGVHVVFVALGNWFVRGAVRPSLGRRSLSTAEGGRRSSLPVPSLSLPLYWNAPPSWRGPSRGSTATSCYTCSRPLLKRVVPSRASIAQSR